MSELFRIDSLFVRPSWGLAEKLERSGYEAYRFEK